MSASNASHASPASAGQTRIRGFEVAAGWEDRAIRLPRRQTGAAAGYDLEAAEDAILKPHAVTVVPTGVKAYMPPDEYLGVHVRSGLSFRHAVSLINGEGIIDADYYGNADNDGHIMVGLFNHSDSPVSIQRGERVAQAIFKPFRIADNDSAGAARRVGGFGSTGQ